MPSAPPGARIDIASVALGIHYERPAAAARFLAEVFGSEPADRLPDGEDPLPEGEHGHPWIEFRIGNVALHVFPLPAGATPERRTHVP